jgi:hypothetical protein
MHKTHQIFHYPAFSLDMSRGDRTAAQTHRKLGKILSVFRLSYLQAEGQSEASKQDTNKIKTQIEDESTVAKSDRETLIDARENVPNAD